MTITKTITGDTPASVTLTALTRTDTGAPVVLSPALPQPFTGPVSNVWSLTFAEPAPGLGYAYTYVITWSDASTEELDGVIVGTEVGGAYLTLAQAVALAATQISSTVAAFVAASSSDQAASLAQATLDIDARRWQGRRFDPAQPFEFPRIAYETAGRVRPQGIVTFVLPPAPSDIVWDWDPVNQLCIIPPKVLLANLFQANFRLLGADALRQGEIHGGIKQSGNSGLMEIYDRTAPGVQSALCRDAYLLLQKYELVSGRLA